MKNLKAAKLAAVKAYLAALEVRVCPLGTGEEHSYAQDEAFCAAADAGVDSDAANAIAYDLLECGGYPRDSWFR